MLPFSPFLSHNAESLDLAHVGMRQSPQPAIPSRATKADLDTYSSRLAGKAP